MVLNYFYEGVTHRARTLYPISRGTMAPARGRKDNAYFETASAKSSKATTAGAKKKHGRGRVGAKKHHGRGRVGTVARGKDRARVGGNTGAGGGQQASPP